MKQVYKIIATCVCLVFWGGYSGKAQTKIGTTLGPGDPSAVLELQSSSQGLLPPRLSTAQRDAIANPATGLMIYNTTVHCIETYTGSTDGWRSLCDSAIIPVFSRLSFTNCNSPVVAGTLTEAQLVSSVTVQLNYVNNSGELYGDLSANPVNGVSIGFTAGSIVPLSAGSGSVTLTVSGTPTVPGNMSIPLVLADAGCNVPLTVAASSVCNDPASMPGSKGCVVFTYRGQQVTYTTVRARDGKIWLQQNLGAARVATAANDATAYGDYFQWGRWDDGHQVGTSTATATALTTNNPSGISSGNTAFLKSWWIGGVNTDTWTAGAPSVTNGTDPCAALGAGWRMPTVADWNTMKSAANENITNITSAFNSNLKIAGSGWRDCRDGYPQNYGQIFADGSRADLWASTTATGSNTYAQHIATSAPDPTSTPTVRGQGHVVRCVK